MDIFQKPKLSLLNDQLIGMIIDEACAVLEKVGVLVENEEARELLHSSNATVNRDDLKVRIPRSLTERSVKTAPPAIPVFDREGRPALQLEGDHIHFDPGSAALTILDWDSQSQRKPVTRDLKRFSRLTHHLGNLSAQSTGLIPSDVPEEIADRYRLFIALQNSAKPVVTGTFAVDAFRSMKEMLLVIRGDAKSLKERPLAIFDCCPSPPLKWSNLTCQNLIDCARAGIPAELVSMPLTGATAPGTIVGALVQHTAENLSGVIIHQLASPGSPIIWGGSPAAFDMRHGTTPMGAIETMMIDSAYALIGKRFNLPTHAYMGLSDAKILDAQAGLETGIGAIIAALSGINVISGPGMLDFESCQSLEKLVIDNDICGMAHRLMKGIELHEGGFSEDLYGDIYHGEHFLTSDTTLTWLRKEFFSPSATICRDHYDMWKLHDGRSAGDRAHQIVDEILSKSDPPYPSPETQRELKDIMMRDAKRYGMDRLPE